jgi:drug/metabolite transporter (DMT)-like permease
MPLIGELAALLTAFLWTGSSFAFTSAAVKIGPLQLNINRMIIAAVFLFITILIFDITLNLSGSQIMNLVYSGIVGLVIGDSFLFKAYQLIGARLSMMLMSLSPAMSAILAFIFLGEELSFSAAIGMFITICGVSLVVLERPESAQVKHSIDKIGIFYGVLGALGQAGGLIFAKLAFQEGDVNKFAATFVRIFSSVIIMLPAAMIFRRYRNPAKLYANNIKAFYATLLGTILGPYLGITFSLIAIDNTKVGIAATLMSTMPIIMLPVVKYFYKESLSWRAIWGAIIAVAGVAILFLR